MKHPIFHEGEDCYALAPSSSGAQWIECEITGPLTRRAIRGLDGTHMGYALTYKVLLEGATRESLFVEGDLRKRWKRGDWAAMKSIWQPKRDSLSISDEGWKQLKEISKSDPYRFHRRIGQDALEKLQKLYDKDKKRGAR